MSLKPNPFKFRATGIGDAPRIKILKITNISRSEPLTGNVGSLASPFTVGRPGPFLLGPGEDLREKIIFKPTTVGLTSQSLVVQSSDAGKPSVSVTVSGTGVSGK